MADKGNTTPVPNGRSQREPGIPWNFVKYVIMVVVPVAAMLTYFFVSQSVQDSSHAATCQRVEHISTTQSGQAKLIDELKAQSADAQKSIHDIQNSLGKIDTNQTLTRQFLEQQLAEIKTDLKEIKRTGGGP